MTLAKMSTGWEILYKYIQINEEGVETLNFRTTPVFTSKKKVEKRIAELHEMDMVQTITVREVKHLNK